MKTFDPKCLELARAFLADEPQLLAAPGKADELASEIQGCIEDWIAGEQWMRDQANLTGRQPRI